MKNSDWFVTDWLLTLFFFLYLENRNWKLIGPSIVQYWWFENRFNYSNRYILCTERADVGGMRKTLARTVHEKQPLRDTGNRLDLTWIQLSKSSRVLFRFRSIQRLIHNLHLQKYLRVKFRLVARETKSLTHKRT